MVIYDSVTIALVLAFILSLVHFFSSKISDKIEKHHTRIISLSAGIFIALLFLDILPQKKVVGTLINTLQWKPVKGKISQGKPTL